MKTRKVKNIIFSFLQVSLGAYKTILRFFIACLQKIKHVKTTPSLNQPQFYDDTTSKANNVINIT